MSKIIAIIAMTALLIPLSDAFAIDLNSMIFAQEDKGFGHIESQHIASLRYDEGSIRSMLENVDRTIEFEIGMDNPSVKEVMNKLNTHLIKELNSPAQFESITILYEGKISGHADTAIITAKVAIDFVIKDLVISGDTIGDGALTDLNWRGLSIKEPLVVTTDQGEININSLSGLIEALHPELAQVLRNTDLYTSLSLPLLDGSEIKKLQLSNWAASFEASGASADAKRLGLVGNIPDVITTYAKGESSFREGILKETHIEKDVTIDGSDVKLSMTIPPAYSTIKLAGYAHLETRNNNEYVVVTDYSTGKQIYQSQNLPLLVLAGFAGMAAVIAGIIIWRANKK